MRVAQILLLVLNMLLFLFGIIWGLVLHREMRVVEFGKALKMYDWQEFQPDGLLLVDYQSVHFKWFLPVLLFGILQLAITVLGMVKIPTRGMRVVGILTLIFVFIHQSLNVILYAQPDHEAMGVNIVLTELVFLLLIGLNLAAALQKGKQAAILPPPVQPPQTNQKGGQNVQNIRIG